eukprot:4831686-Amphidinium_carterae.1
MGTIAKQPCKPKARRQKGREGKAPCKQSGGALPALPPGSRPRGRAPGPNKKLKSHDSRMPIASSSGVTQATQGRAPGPSKKLRSHDSRVPIASSSCAPQAPESLRVPEQRQLTFPASRSEEPGGSSGDHERSQCALCRGFVHVETLRGRAIRDQVVQVCCECFTTHPKTIPRFREALPEASGVKRKLERDPEVSEETSGKRSRRGL